MASQPELLTEAKPIRDKAPAHAITSRWPRWLLPSHADFLLVTLIVWLFIVSGGGWGLLLADGDTGWHIRVGEYVLDTGVIPTTDLFSFSKPGGEWYAWEWLADVAYALAHRWAGLRGVVALAGILVALYGVLLIRLLVWMGANGVVAMVVGMLAIGASSVHFLARPHIFTMIGLVAVVWLLERDRRRPGPALWALVPATALWANVHGGFVVLFPFLGSLILGTAAEAALARPGEPRKWHEPARYGLLACACAAASLVNPFGVRLHSHIVSYLQAGWIRDTVQEFKAPTFRTESHLQFEILLVAGLMASWSLLSRRRLVGPILIAVWAHLSLTSVRHIPIYVIAAAPIIATEAMRLWSATVARSRPTSVISILSQFATELAHGFGRFSIWAVLMLVMLVSVGGERMRWPKDFPEAQFPIALINRNLDRFPAARVFANDEWADYLLYRFYPRQRVFFDGRSDYYGEDLMREFVSAYLGRRDWADVLDRHQCDLVLVPTDCALATLIAGDRRWRLVDSDDQAVLFARAVQARPRADNGETGS